MTCNYADQILIIDYLLAHYRKAAFLLQCEQRLEAGIFVDWLNQSLAILNEDQRRIIVNDFVERKPRGWWQEYYSRTTYYRLRKSGIQTLYICVHR